LWNESGYFDSAAEFKPLLHLWSLGVEEQFYIFWPLLLWLAWKYRVRSLAMTWAIIAASFLLNIWMMGFDATGAFYSPLARFWELLSGAVLAHSSLSRPPSPQNPGAHRPANNGESRYGRGLTGHAQSLLGATMIGAAVLFLDKNAAFPGWWALLPVAGAYLLIAAGPTALLNRYLLATRPFVFIGLISYPLYLWHWPLLAFARIVSSTPPSPWARISLIFLSVVLAALTYRFVEKPLRFGALHKKVYALALSMTVLASGAAVIYFMNGFESRFKNEAASYALLKYDFRHDARINTCWLSDDRAADAFSPDCVDGSTGVAKPLIVLWGDSHAARLFPGFRNVAGDRFALAQFTRDACAPFPDTGYANCVNGNKYVLSRIGQLRPSTVVLFAYWTEHMSGDRQSAASQLEKSVSELKRMGVDRVVIVGPAPKWNVPLPDNVVKLVQSQGLERVPRRTSFGLDRSSAELDTYMHARFRDRDDVTYFSAMGSMCNSDGCLIRTGDTAASVTSWDYGHLTTPAAEYLTRELFKDSNYFRPR
jgi:hypothetical protein